MWLDDGEYVEMHADQLNGDHIGQQVYTYADEAEVKGILISVRIEHELNMPSTVRMRIGRVIVDAHASDSVHVMTSETQQ